MQRAGGADAGRAEPEGERIELLDVEPDHQRAGVIVGAGADRLAGAGEAEEREQRRDATTRAERRIDARPCRPAAARARSCRRRSRRWTLRASGPKTISRPLTMMIATASISMNCCAPAASMKRIDRGRAAAHSRSRTAPRAIGSIISERIEAEGSNEQHQARYIADDHHLAVGEIDDAHDAEDDRQAERHQPVDEAGQEAR